MVMKNALHITKTNVTKTDKMQPLIFYRILQAT